MAYVWFGGSVRVCTDVDIRSIPPPPPSSRKRSKDNIPCGASRRGTASGADSTLDWSRSTRRRSRPSCCTRHTRTRRCTPTNTRPSRTGGCAPHRTPRATCNKITDVSRLTQAGTVGRYTRQLTQRCTPGVCCSRRPAHTMSSGTLPWTPSKRMPRRMYANQWQWIATKADLAAALSTVRLLVTIDPTCNHCKARLTGHPAAAASASWSYAAAPAGAGVVRRHGRGGDGGPDRGPHQVRSLTSQTP